MLIKTAFERGEEFSEAYRAISLYLLNSDVFSMDSYGNLNLILLTDLIFETLNLYDQIKTQFALVSLHDNIRLVAEQIIKSYEKTMNCESEFFSFYLVLKLIFNGSGC